MHRPRNRRTDLVELTSKPLKLQSALSGLLLLAGVILALGKSPIGLPLALLGFLWHSITRIRIWWNHG